MQTQPLSKELQYAQLLLNRQQSHDSLIRFAQTIPIAGVPLQDVAELSDDAYDVVETPLAKHHRLILECLQAMVDQELTYQLDDQGEPSFALQPPSSIPQPPCRGRLDGGGRFGIKYPHLSEYLSTHAQSESTTKNITPDNGQLMPNSDQLLTNNHGDIQENGLIVAKDRSKVRICLNVMLMFPPGSAKSTYASVVFPSWDMGRNPYHEIILTGYGDTICKKHGKRARQMCNSDAYSNVFGTGLDPNTRAADDWQLRNGSSYKSAGILSGITGFRCDGLIWDDLTKGRKEADSLGIRNDTYNAYLDDARSRKKPQAWEVGIGTRWHEDEIMGRILPAGFAGESGFMLCRDGNVWFVICVPAQAEREDDPLGREVGEYIWPEWFGEGFWKDKRINPRSWASLYQQRPAPDEGLYFKKDWFREYDVIPKNVNHYISFDPAVSDKEDADDTCIEIWAVDDMMRVYKVDEWVGKVTMDIWIDIILDYVKMYKPLEVISESGVIRRAAEPFLTRAMRKRRIFAVFEWVSRNADKSAMARPLQAMVASGQVYFPKNSVGEKTRDEYVRFPAGKDDHRVDSGANFCLRLEKIWETAPPDEIKEDSVILGGAIPIKSLMPPRFSKKRSRWSFKSPSRN